MIKTSVYIVDDDQHVRESLAWLLESVQLTTQLFANGHEFLELMKKKGVSF